MQISIILFILLICFVQINMLSITSPHCHKNISVKYFQPIEKRRPSRSYNINENKLNELQQTEFTEQYLDFEERVRWDLVPMCCPGYRTIIFGFCEPLCETSCPQYSFCAEPNKCRCNSGYEPSHHANKEHALICRPVCLGSCPEHSHCVAHNECQCRAGFRNINHGWFSSTVRCERISCPIDQRYDIVHKTCVKIDMSMEELMRKVAAKLESGNQNSEES